MTYPFTNETDVLTSRGRQAAVRLMEERCPPGYEIRREGEVAKVAKGIDKAWSGQLGTDRLWAIQFMCK